MDVVLEGICGAAMNVDGFEHDVELRRIDPAKNCFRVYGLSVCVTLFGEPCLRIVWGRRGHRPLRERSETFSNSEALRERRAELLERRRRHGYEPVGASWEQLVGTRFPAAHEEPVGMVAAMEREIVESHGLSPGDAVARALVARWYAAAAELRRYVSARGHAEVDLVDVSTLASMYHRVA